MGAKRQITAVRKVRRCLKMTRDKTLRKKYVLKVNIKTPPTWKRCPMVGTIKCIYFFLHYFKKSQVILGKKAMFLLSFALILSFGAHRGPFTVAIITNHLLPLTHKVL